MTIVREDFDRQPLLIRQGALALWGILIGKRVDLCRVRYLYSISDFFAEMCYDLVSGKLTCICTFTRYERLESYLETLPPDLLS